MREAHGRASSWWATAIGVTAALVAGCSDANLSGEQAGSALGREKLSEVVAAWRCDGFATCCGEAEIEFDRASCLEAQRDRRLRRWGEEESSGLAFDERGSGACAAELRDLEPACPPRLPDECRRVFEGQKEIGAECGTRKECAGWREKRVSCILGRCTETYPPGSDCAPACDGFGHCTRSCNFCRLDSQCLEDESGSLRCVAIEKSVAAAGESCGLADRIVPVGTERIRDVECESGFWCGAPRLGQPPVCRPVAARGEPCPLFVPCAEGLACVDGVCGDPVFAAIGESCSRSADCEPGLRCNAGECIRPTVREPGEPCPGFFDCAEGSFCHPSERRCVEFAGLGEACGETRAFYRPCGSPLRCRVDAGADPSNEAGTCVTTAAARCLNAS